MITDKHYDVLVVGGGNAGLSAALTAREAGASVLVIESAPEAFRGGNSRHVRNLRVLHDAPLGVLAGTYTMEEYWADLMQVTAGRTNEALARLTLTESTACYTWMVEQGARFQPPLGGTLHLNRTNAFFLGGGKALLNAYYRRAIETGIDILYDTALVDLETGSGVARTATVMHQGRAHTLPVNAVVLAAGGFQANIDWLREAWGEAANNFIIRGTPYDDGRVLRLMMHAGAETIGDPAQCHAIAVDARAPRYDAGIVSRVDCVSLGIVVNREAQRFYDEGEDFWPKRYAIWGRLIAQQPGQIAWVIIDSKSADLYLPPLTSAIRADSIAGLATELGLEGEALQQTLDTYNAAVREGSFDHQSRDDCHTEGLAPPKSHWARRIDTPPYLAYPLRPGITFTYLGLRVDERARVQFADHGPAENIYAAGEIMAGNILGQGYLAGIGMTIGTAFGRIAGREAASHV